MGQEWAASTPFQYFTDLDAGLGKQVTEGRRREFAAFPEFSDEEARHSIPDPQARSTFESSRLRWDERAEPAHRAVLELYRALIALRLDHPSALGASAGVAGDAIALDDETVAVRRADGGDVFWVIVRFMSAGLVDLTDATEARGEGAAEWSVVLTTEDPLFALDPRPPQVDERAGPLIRFERAGAVILRRM
jgi:maltooligosyltrehalose trehalohydrolase